jgi:mRNA-degrading endonuclease toxin of MazEF toxin-antitoxin module
LCMVNVTTNQVLHHHGKVFLEEIAATTQRSVALCNCSRAASWTNLGQKLTKASLAGILLAHSDLPWQDEVLKHSSA